MKINEVAKKTGLTKKAIRYYEEKGLITVDVNEENGYKLYSDKNMEDLQAIAFLRNMDMPVMQIKEYLLAPDQREIILQEHLGHIQQQMSHLDIITDMIHQLMVQNTGDYSGLNKRLMAHQQQGPDYVLKQLANLFPGVFGKYIVIHFGSFLNTPLDSEEKKKAFDNLVSYLDDSAPIILPDDMQAYLEDVDTDELIKNYTHINENLLEIARMDAKDAKEKLTDQLKEYMDMSADHGMQEEFKKFRVQNELFRKQLEESGYYKEVVENMRIISPSYDQYIRNWQRLDRTLNVRYDSEGRIIIDDTDTEAEEDSLSQDPP